MSLTKGEGEGRRFQTKFHQNHSNRMILPYCRCCSGNRDMQTEAGLGFDISRGEGAGEGNID